MNKKDLLLSIGVLLILIIPFMVALGAYFLPRAISQPKTSTALSEACTIRSPNGRFCAGAVDGQGAIVRADDGGVFMSSWVKLTKFHGWTADGRYALFDHYDQYGNSRGVLFDVETWQSSKPGGACAYPDRMSASCRFGFELIDLDRGKILQGTGILYDLQAGTEINLFPEPDKALVWLGSFSPDKEQAAFFGAPEMVDGYPGDTAVTLYIVDMDNGHMTVVPDLTFSPADLYTTTLQWAENSQSVMFQTNDGQVYRYHLETEQIERP